MEEESSLPLHFQISHDELLESLQDEFTKQCNEGNISQFLNDHPEFFNRLLYYAEKITNEYSIAMPSEINTFSTDDAEGISPNREEDESRS